MRVIIDNINKMDMLERKIDKLCKEMEEINKLINEMKSETPKEYKDPSLNKSIKKKIIVIDDRTKWKRGIYEQIKIITNKKHLFNKRSEVLHYIYNYMRKNYGIVWEQDVKEYKEKFETDYKPQTIDVIYFNKIYKSIFESILIDMVVNIESKIDKSCFFSIKN